MRLIENREVAGVRRRARLPWRRREEGASDHRNRNGVGAFRDQPHRRRLRTFPHRRVSSFRLHDHQLRMHVAWRRAQCLAECARGAKRKGHQDQDASPGTRAARRMRVSRWMRSSTNDDQIWQRVFCKFDHRFATCALRNPLQHARHRVQDRPVCAGVRSDLRGMAIATSRQTSGAPPARSASPPYRRRDVRRDINGRAVADHRGD